MYKIFAILSLLISNNSNSYLGDGKVTAPVHTLELFITDKNSFISCSSVIDCFPLIFIVFVFDIVSFIIFLFGKEVEIKSEEIRKELSFKKYFFYKMFTLMIYFVYSISCIFIFDKFINDKYFVATFVIVITVWGLIYTIMSSIYKAILEKKINEKLKEKKLIKEN